MYSYRTLLREGEERLANAGIFEAKNDAWLLLSSASGFSRTNYLMRSEDAVPEDVCEAFNQKLNRRLNHEPLQYIEGSAPFMGYDFYVDENVLIPRMDTEVLVCKAIELVQSGQNISVLDMCTGSGCIIESIFLELTKKGMCVTAAASDVSEGALTVAKKNADRLSAKVTFFQGNLFENVTGKYNIITSNPPYIRTDVIRGLEPEVKEHEPMLALDGYEDGLYFYRKIVEDAYEYLCEGGYLVMEIGHDQGADVSCLCADRGYEGIEVIRDLAGLDRVVVAKRVQKEV